MTEDGASFQGVYANLPTGFNESGESVDVSRMTDHIQWLIDNGVDGVSCLLSSGTFTYLSRRERHDVVTAVVAAVAGKIPVLAGVSGETTADTITLGNEAFAAGCDAVLVQPRSYFRLTEHEVLAHYEEVAGGVHGKIGIYNNPATTGVDLTAAMYSEIVRATGAVVTKDGSGRVFNVPDVMEASGPSLSYLWGTETTVLAGLASGADGCCLALASVFPEEIVDMRRKLNAGQLDEARGAYRALLPILRVFNSIGTARAVREVAKIRGFDLGGPRRPMMPLGQDAVSGIEKALASQPRI